MYVYIYFKMRSHLFIHCVYCSHRCHSSSHLIYLSVLWWHHHHLSSLLLLLHRAMQSMVSFALRVCVLDVRMMPSLLNPSHAPSQSTEKGQINARSVRALTIPRHACIRICARIPSIRLYMHSRRAVIVC